MAFLQWVDLIGVLFNAMLGAVIARGARMDIIAFLVLGIMTGLGGGMIRDTLLQVGPPVALTDWRYLSENKVQFSFVGEFALTFSVRAPGSCRVEVQGRQFVGRKAQGLSHFQLPMKQVRDARLTCS